MKIHGILLLFVENSCQWTSFSKHQARIGWFVEGFLCQTQPTFLRLRVVLPHQVLQIRQTLIKCAELLSPLEEIDSYAAHRTQIAACPPLATRWRTSA